MAKKGYQLPDGTIVANFREIAQALGVEKVVRADIEEGGQYADMVSTVDLEGQDETTETDTKSEENTTGQDTKKEDTKKDAKSDKSEDKQDNKDKAPKQEDETVDKTQIYSAVNPAEVTVTPEEIKAMMPEFKTIDELKDLIKDIDTPTLEYMARGLKLEWVPTYHQSIHRMRIAMEIKKYFFPELFTPKGEGKKKKSKYGDFTTQQLYSMAKEFKVKWDKTGNEPIDRMRVIMALKQSGHLAD